MITSYYSDDSDSSHRYDVTRPAACYCFCVPWETKTTGECHVHVPPDSPSLWGTRSPLQYVVP